MCFLLFAFFGVHSGDHRSGERGKSDDVGQNHQLVEKILQFPCQIVFDESAGKYEQQRQQGIYHSGFFAEKIVEVDLAEKIPADDRGKGEKEQTDRYKNVSGGS